MTNHTDVGQSIFFKGPSSHVHVPNDKNFYIHGTSLALDIGWVGHLEHGTAGKGVRASGTAGPNRRAGLGHGGNHGNRANSSSPIGDVHAPPSAAHRRTVKGGITVTDGKPHTITLHYDEASSTYTLTVDGVVDATASFGAADQSPSDWVRVKKNKLKQKHYPTGFLVESKTLIEAPRSIHRNGMHTTPPHYQSVSSFGSASSYPCRLC